jgi:acyl transferase domain-containing protein
LQLALIELLRSFGVVPDIVLGHSSGEIAAAYAIVALSHESAIKVAYWRGQLAEKLRVAGGGAMMSVNLTESQVPEYLEKAGLGQNTLYIACVNSPSNVTLSGPSEAIDTLKSHLDEEQIFAQKVNTGVAYHSPVCVTVPNYILRGLARSSRVS